MDKKTDCVVIEKPADISFDEIHKVLWEANADNRSKGFTLNTSRYSGEELAEKIGENGKCFVAISDNRIVGTSTVKIVERNKWYIQGKVPVWIMVGVIPEYQGKGVMTKLANEVFKYVRENNYSALELDTAKKNTHAIDVYLHQGFELVDFKKIQNTDHFSVVMVKWFSDRPYSDLKRKTMFAYKRFITRSKYYIKRILMLSKSNH